MLYDATSQIATSIFLIIGAIQIRKIIRDSGESCVATRLVFPLLLILLSHSHLNLLALKNLLIHRIQFFPFSNFSNSLITCSSLTILNLSFTYQKLYPTASLFPRYRCVLVTILNATWVVDLLLTDPNWCLCRSPHPYSISATTFSSNLPIQLIKLIGLHPFVFSWSFPGLGIITTLLFCHSLGIVPLIMYLSTYSITFSLRIVSLIALINL